MTADRTRPGIGSMEPLELARRLAGPEPLLLLDVREPEERAHCRIEAPPGVVQLAIPLGELAVREHEVASLAGVEGLPIVVYCHHGVRSRMAARWLARNGLSGLHNLERGIEAWSVEVDPSVPRY